MAAVQKPSSSSSQSRTWAGTCGWEEHSRWAGGQKKSKLIASRQASKGWQLMLSWVLNSQQKQKREKDTERERQKGRNKKRKKDKKEERSKRKNESEANEETPNYTNPYHDERPGCWRWSLTANNGLLHHFAIKSRVYMVRPSQLSLPRLPSGQRLATPPRKKWGIVNAETGCCWDSCQLLHGFLSGLYLCVVDVVLKND